MDLNYLIKDYRLTEGRFDNTSYGIKLPSWEKSNPLMVKYVDGGYWVLEDGNKVCPVEDSMPSGDPDERPDSKTFHSAGRTFVVGYYHDGGPAWVREILE